MCSIRAAFILMIMLLAPGCGSMQEDLFPSGTDRRPPVQQGTTGPAVGQYAPDFTLPDSLGNAVTLSSFVPDNRGVVLYFTMWCVTCDSDMSYMRDNLTDQNKDIIFLAVDWVSKSVSEARGAEVSSLGYDQSDFIVLADTAQTVLDLYKGSMGTTVVIDRNGVIRMNEGFKTDRLRNLLAELQ